MSTTLSKVDKGTLLTIPNPRYVVITSKYQHLKGVGIDNTSFSKSLIIHKENTKKINV